jgi:membrane-associated phospholipid phosphatase
MLAPVPFVVHAAWAKSIGELRWENVGALAIALYLTATGARSKKLLAGIYPMGLIGLLYTSMKVVRDIGVSPARVHVCDLRAHEVALFGITVQGTRTTVHDWLQPHATPLLDALCAIPYATFLFVCVGCAVWLYFRDYPRMLEIGWGFFFVSVAGFLTYHLYPAAPPWYFHLYGCRVDMLAPSSPGPNLLRIDARFGTTYFAGMYGRASEVFGAMPSLHAAYALLVVLAGWATFSNLFRVLAVAFFALMCFGAVYLDHHWILDVLAGCVYCVAVVSVLRLTARARWRRASRPSEAALQDEGASGGGP